MKAELKEREERARKRREQMLAERMKRMQGQNQNTPQQPESEGFMTGIMRKIKGEQAA